ncbi:hypothetical protein BKA64DRAFT_44431 [Cadophora sp. MPI-SDFR-AT-0126]|nr:hypothetical protein BKA64DRAFT_44431 [Leotiomycetes sp. MPI-SDFR-AT-0126]
MLPVALDHLNMLSFQDVFKLKSGSGLSIGALTFDECHPSPNTLDKLPRGSSPSSTCSAVVAVMLAVMLSFRFEGNVSATRLDFIIAWIPPVLLDWSIVSDLLGISTCYWQKMIGGAVG